MDEYSLPADSLGLDDIRDLLTLCRDNDVARVKYRGFEADFHARSLQTEEQTATGFDLPKAEIKPLQAPDAEEYSDYHKVFGGVMPRFKKPPQPPEV